jgi:hypothetical protein
MKIYRNNVAIELHLEEFLDVIESDLLDELILVVMELDNAHEEVTPSKKWLDVKKNVPAPKEIIYEEHIVDNLDGLMDFLQEMGLSEDDVDVQVIHYDGNLDDIPEEFWDQLGDGWTEIGDGDHWVDDLDGAQNVYYTTYNESEDELTSEDRKIRRILNRYRFMTE